jgi:hypothetical protein
MESKLIFLLAADALLFTHVLVILFVIFGLLFIIVGKFLSWSWVRNFWFRLVHLITIAVVAVQSWLGQVCPLTTWEMALREQAGDQVYAGSCISHWLEVVFFYSAPGWVFALSYTGFGLLVLVSWFWVRPNPFRRH